jgi:hypothetical protein
MALFNSPNISTNGLVLCLDAASKQSYNPAHNLIANSGVSDASGTTFPTGWYLGQGLGGFAAGYIAPSNGISKTINGIGYWQFDLVGTANGYGNRLLLDTDLINITQNTTYTFTYNYNLPIPYLTRGAAISLNTLYYSSSYAYLGGSIQDWQNSSGYNKSSFSFTTPAGTTFIKIRLDFVGINATMTGEAINYANFLFGGFQLNTGSAVTDYIATTTSQVLPSTSWKDISGSGNIGTLTNGPTYSSENGGAIVFDGTNDFCQLNTFADLEQSSFTFEVVFKTTAADTRLIVGKYSGVGADYWLGTQPKLNWSFGSPAKVDIRSNANVNDNVYKVAHAIYDKSTSQTFLYVNGVFQSQGSVPATITSATGNLRLGTWEAGGFFFPGSLPVFKIYNRALTATEIQQNYNALRGRFGL